MSRKADPKSYRQQLLAIFEDGEHHHLADIIPDFIDQGMTVGSFHASIHLLHQGGFLQRMGYGEYRKALGDKAEIASLRSEVQDLKRQLRRAQERR